MLVDREREGEREGEREKERERKRARERRKERDKRQRQTDTERHTHTHTHTHTERERERERERCWLTKAHGQNDHTRSDQAPRHILPNEQADALDAGSQGDRGRAAAQAQLLKSTLCDIFVCFCTGDALQPAVQGF